VTLSTVIDPSDRKVFTDTDETITVDTGCDKTIEDAHKVIDTHCAMCHAVGAASLGNPPFGFIKDEAQLIAKTWDREGQATGTGPRFLTPGDPMNSLIYTRAAVARDMPPLQLSLDQPFYERVTFSEGSVLREWIEKCMDPEAPPTGGTGGSTGAGGTTGAGGATGGSPDAGTTDPDAGTALAACAGGVANNGNCMNAQPCALGAQTCTCTAVGGGNRRWVCAN
jgi:hypothetical protein